MALVQGHALAFTEHLLCARPRAVPGITHNPPNTSASWYCYFPFQMLKLRPSDLPGFTIRQSWDWNPKSLLFPLTTRWKGPQLSPQLGKRWRLGFNPKSARQNTRGSFGDRSRLGQSPCVRSKLRPPPHSCAPPALQPCGEEAELAGSPPT